MIERREADQRVNRAPSDGTSVFVGILEIILALTRIPAIILCVILGATLFLWVIRGLWHGF